MTVWVRPKGSDEWKEVPKGLDLRTFTVGHLADDTETIRDMENAYGLIQKTYNVMGTGFSRMTYETLMDCLEDLDVARENLADAAERVLTDVASRSKEATP